ncbi:hypothetical protein ACIQVR_38040 [Streptomyces xanthochromogenes]|uniref:hypothetical protein n=1 Tax=Streptomyces xanthochromogenes TaxID=67384 RepID=UPI00382E0EC7
MTDIAAALDDPAVPPTAPVDPVAGDETPLPPKGLFGDELRARAWLWHRLGVGAYAAGGTA